MSGPDPRDWAEVIASRLTRLGMGQCPQAQELAAALVGVMNLHAAKGEGQLLVCEGCDIDGFDAEHPSWPCTTVMTIAADLGIPTTATCPRCEQNTDLRPDGTFCRHLWAIRNRPGGRADYFDCPGSEQHHSPNQLGADQQEPTHT